MIILLFGKGGQVGWELQRSLAPLGKLVALGTDSEDLCGDFTDLDGITETVRSVKPNIIVNAAAYTAVDKAESETDLCHKVNTLAPAILAQEAKKIGAWLINYSTDYVFDGSGDKPWSETDPTGPLSVFGAPTGAELLADASAYAIRTALQSPEVSGLYHLVAGGQTSWHEYASFVIELARQAGVEIKVSAEAIHPVPTSSYPTPAKRPGNSRLNTGKFENTFDLYLPHWQSGVTRMLTEILEK